MSLVQELSSLGLEIEELHTDVVIVGGGGAASRAALSAKLAGANVLLLAKAPLGVGGSTVHGASEIMSMGASGYGSKSDSPEIHYRDTMAAATGFIDPNLVRVLAEDAPARIKDLIDFGVAFDKAGHGATHGAQPGEERDYKLIRSDFGSYARAMGVSGKTGKAFVAALAEQALARGVLVRTPAALIDLLFDAQGRAAGVLAFDSEKNRWLIVHARSVVLGTGGAHGLFSQQVSTSEMTGDGQAACWRAGAELVNMEFHQFGPALIHPYIQLFSKACFVLHPRMTNALGEEFLTRYLPSGTSPEEAHDEKVFPFTVSNASRWIDISIAREIAEGRGTARGGVHFSFAHVDAERLQKTMPNTTRWMHERGLNPQKDLLDVGIAFQCLNGGVRMMDPDARTSLAGVHVIGELAGGIRGPDRPGGNSLAEGQVFGHRAGHAAAKDALASGPSQPPAASGVADRLHRALQKNAGFDAEHATLDLQAAMQRHVLVEKNESGLRAALDVAERIGQALSIGGNATANQLQQILTLDNMATTAQIILRACMERRETRSGHYRTDYPQRDDTKFGHAYSLKLEGTTFAFNTIVYPVNA
ncbi:MAG TPA: FAD-binding protein [Burkholderiaceae bacterium]|nr:FAD-binding protein [Burkholderiaceae bacterium]